MPGVSMVRRGAFMFKRKSIFMSAVILTSASIFTRVVGFVYRVFLANTIGAEGIGLHQLIFPVYSLAWSITCSGFTTTISKLVAQENAKRESGNMGKVLKLSLFITGAISAAVALLMFAFAQTIANNIFHDGRTLLSIKILAFAVPFMTAGSCIRGYFIGLREPFTPAVSQIAEQVTRMAVVFMVAPVLIPMGLEFACAAAVFGILGGEFISCIYQLYAYRVFKTRNSLIRKPSFETRQTVSMIFSMALPLTLSRITGSFLSTVENILIPQRLVAFGMTGTEAISAFGRISGMAMPLIFFPSAFLTALSVTLVPAISEASALKNSERIKNTISKSLIFTLLLGIGASTVFIVLPREIGQLIYKQDIGGILLMLGFLCPFLYVNITLSGMLNGLGQQVLLFKNNLISSLINIACVYFLIPIFGISAFIIGWTSSLAVVIVISLIKIYKLTGLSLNLPKWLGKPALAALATSLTVNLIKTRLIIPNFGENILGVSITLALLLGGYCFFIVLLKCISWTEIMSIYKKTS